MSMERRFKGTPATATVGLTDGRTFVGQLRRFTPSDPDLPLVVRTMDVSGLPSESLQRVASEQIAYLALHRGNATAPPEAPHGTPLDIHVAGGLTFTVLADPETISDRLGFWSTPLNPNSAFVELFFYAHGVNAREEKTTLGDILLETGMLGGEGLAKGLEEQAASRAANLGDILIEQKRVAPEAVEAAATQQQESGVRGRRLRMGEVLVEAGLAREEDIQAALEEQKKRRGKRIGEVLVEMGLVSEVEMARALSRKFNLPFVDLDRIPSDSAAMGLVQPDLVKKYQVLPIKADKNSLTIAMADPLAFEAMDMLRFTLGRRIIEMVATPSQLAARIESMLVMMDTPVPAHQMEEILSGIEIETVTEGVPDARDLTIARDDDSGISKLVNQIIYDAHARGASDIHFEPDGEQNQTSVRFRIDGVCEVYRKFEPAIRARLVSRLKIMAQLDITERRKPQDGKIRLRLKDKPIELRVSTIPTVTRDEDVVLRVLSSGEPLPLEQLNLSTHNLEEVRGLIQKAYGLVLAVGPTGSGKTTTLHSCIGAINTPARKIWTAEDPVEIVQRGLRQVQVNPKIGFTFAAALRSFLRADPDVIMVGEMRDEETASIAIEASLTGHLVFSTLHTNTAPETITRLVDMGLDSFTFSDALLGVIAQRLSRKLCRMCKQAYEPDAQECKALAKHYGAKEWEELMEGRTPSLYHAVGCKACGGRGYRGRIAIHEVLVNTDDMKLAIQKRATLTKMRTIAKTDGMRTLIQDGIEKCLEGHTDLRQVLAVCQR